MTDLLRLEDDLWDSESFGAAVGLYLVWQIGYWVVTEVIFSHAKGGQYLFSNGLLLLCRIFFY